MNKFSAGTILHEDGNVRYQIYSEEYYDQTFQSVLESRVAKGTIYSDFGIQGNMLFSSIDTLIKQSVFIILALDMSYEKPMVVGTIIMEDFIDFISEQDVPTELTKIKVLKTINKKLLSPITNIPLKRGDILIGSGYGVKKEYQNSSIGKNLSILMVNVSLDTQYKVFCGLFYSRKASSIMIKSGGGFLMCQLKIEECKGVDSNIDSYMKNDIEIVAMLNFNQDASEFECLKGVLQQQQDGNIQPSL